MTSVPDPERSSTTGSPEPIEELTPRTPGWVPPADTLRPERRWPSVLAAFTAMAIHQLLPADFKVSPTWLYPVVMIGFVIVLMIGDPGVLDQEKRWLRVVTNLAIATIAVANLVATVRLVVGILEGSNYAKNAADLLLTGAVVWTANIIAFGLWYWDVDGGGSAARGRRGAWADPAFVFPEMNLGYAERGWYPHFADYLALSFNTATAFSPTDVSAVKRWAKMLMIVESATSLVIATLVIAQAINSLN